MSLYRSKLQQKPLLLILPPEYKTAINPYDGNFLIDSPYHNCTLRKLFMERVNYEYLFKELVVMISNRQFVFNTLPATIPNREQIAELLAANIRSIQPLFYQWMNDVKMPRYEDIEYNNIPYQLHEINQQFVTELAATLCATPQMVVPDIDRLNPDTGKIEYGEYDYDPSSYFGGTWRPEDLFLNNDNNRNNPYWRAYSYGIDITDAAAGVNNVYNRPIYSNGGGTSRFPIWQTSGQRRNYSRDNHDISNGQGAISDYATNTNRGYDMTALRNIPHSR